MTTRTLACLAFALWPIASSLGVTLGVAAASLEGASLLLWVGWSLLIIAAFEVTAALATRALRNGPRRP